MDESMEASERVKALRLDAEGFFPLVRDLDLGETRESLQTGTRLKLLDLELHSDRRWFARVRPKHHEDEDAFVIALDKLI